MIIYLFYLFCLSALLAVTIVNYILSFTAVALFFVFYTKPDGCSINKFFISFNMLFCITVSVISVLPKVQVSTSVSGERSRSAFQGNSRERFSAL